jgi:hypothetical protein
MQASRRTRIAGRYGDVGCIRYGVCRAKNDSEIL